MRGIALWFLTLPVSAAFAKPPPGHPPGPPPLAHVIEHHADEIGVDAATVAEAHATMEAGGPTAEALHADLRAAHEALRAAMEADIPDPSTVYDASTSLAQAELAMRNHRLSVDLAVIALLTPEEWEALRSMRPDGPPGRRGFPPRP